MTTNGVTALILDRQPQLVRPRSQRVLAGAIGALGLPTYAGTGHHRRGGLHGARICRVPGCQEGCVITSPVGLHDPPSTADNSADSG